MKVALFVAWYVDAFFPEVVSPLDRTCRAQPMASNGCHPRAAATAARHAVPMTGPSTAADIEGG